MRIEGTRAVHHGRCSRAECEGTLTRISAIALGSAEGRGNRRAASFGAQHIDADLRQGARSVVLVGRLVAQSVLTPRHPAAVAAKRYRLAVGVDDAKDREGASGIVRDLRSASRSELTRRGDAAEQGLAAR